MKVLLTGATGYIGTAVAEALRGAGHTVVGLARTPEKLALLQSRGLEARSGDILKPETVVAAARNTDGIIHTANTNDANAAHTDIQVVRALLQVLENSQKPFIYTSGVWVLGPSDGRILDERSPVNPTPLVAHRPPLEQEILGYKTRGVRAIVIRPAIVYGRGSGILNMMVQSAKDSGSATYVGDGENHWSFVDVVDLAHLYALALEKAPAGSLFNGAHGPFYRTRELAEAASVGAGKNGSTKSWPLPEARKTLGAFADALAMDQRVSGEKAERELGWTPQDPSVLDELKTGSYARK
jgi:nucleoside-diphosphate-sugar epimerase